MSRPLGLRVVIGYVLTCFKVKAGSGYPVTKTRNAQITDSIYKL